MLIKEIITIPIIIDTYRYILSEGENEQKSICVGTFNICKVRKREEFVAINGMDIRNREFTSATRRHWFPIKTD